MSIFVTARYLRNPEFLEGSLLGTEDQDLGFVAVESEK
jgi:hypothetical protein